MPVELAGLVLWLLFDLPVLYATVTQAKHSFAASPLAARNISMLLGILTVCCAAAHLLFARWWLAEPHRSHGSKEGKPWSGLEARNTTDLAWWSAGLSHFVCAERLVVGDAAEPRTFWRAKLRNVGVYR